MIGCGQSPKIGIEFDSTKTKPYVSLVGYLMYIQACIGPGLQHWVTTKDDLSI